MKEGKSKTGTVRSKQ